MDIHAIIYHQVVAVQIATSIIAIAVLVPKMTTLGSVVRERYVNVAAGQISAKSWAIVEIFRYIFHSHRILVT